VVPLVAQVFTALVARVAPRVRVVPVVMAGRVRQVQREPARSPQEVAVAQAVTERLVARVVLVVPADRVLGRLRMVLMEWVALVVGVEMRAKEGPVVPGLSVQPAVMVVPRATAVTAVRVVTAV
jgi:hypothetical protein